VPDVSSLGSTGADPYADDVVVDNDRIAAVTEAHRRGKRGSASPPWKPSSRPPHSATRSCSARRAR